MARSKLLKPAPEPETTITLRLTSERRVMKVENQDREVALFHPVTVIVERRRHHIAVHGTLIGACRLAENPHEIRYVVKDDRGFLVLYTSAEIERWNQGKALEVELPVKQGAAPETVHGAGGIKTTISEMRDRFFGVGNKKRE